MPTPLGHRASTQEALRVARDLGDNGKLALRMDAADI